MEQDQTDNLFQRQRSVASRFSKVCLNIFKVVLVGCLVSSLAACSGAPSLSSMFGSSKKEVGDAPEAPPEVLYKQAEDAMSKSSFSDAATKYEEVDRLHPYSPHARRSIVMAAYAYQKNGKHPEAINAAKRYITLHPGTKEAALAQNIIASCYYDQMSGEKNDQSLSQKALKEYQILVQQYPESTYAQQAQNRIRIISDVLAAAEMNVAIYYLKRNQHLAAVNRLKTIVTEYQNTRHVEEALARLTETYLTLGIQSEARTAAAVLGHNFPQSNWYKEAYGTLQKRGLSPQEDKGSWISKAWTTTVTPSNS